MRSVTVPVSGSVTLRRKQQLPIQEIGWPALIGAIVLLIHVLVAVTAHFWAPYSPTALLSGAPLSPPSAEHWFGTDQLGRDVFSRVVTATRIDLGLALSATALGVALGGIVGLLMAYMRGWLDEVVMRLIDTIICIPPLILSLLVISAIGTAPFLLVLTVALVYAPRVTRTTRAAGLEIATADFITVARARGESPLAIVLRELAPNALSTLFVEFAIRSGFAVIMIGSLGFLGFGIRPPTPEWGVMISESRNAISVAPWTVFYPALAMSTLVIALNLVTEAVARLLGHQITKGSN